MEIPIQVAVRVRKLDNDEDKLIRLVPSAPVISPTLTDANLTTGMVHVGNHSFPVTHALPMNCSQSEIFGRTLPLLMMFLEGFDASVITYGQSKCGKTFTLFGREFEDELNEGQTEETGKTVNNDNEDEEGIVQQSVRQIFSNLTTYLSNRSFIINIGWVELSNGSQIKDLLETGIVQCQNANEAFHWLRVGARNRCRDLNTHHMFTLTLEQQWINPSDGLFQHRLSTISFCDLASTERALVMTPISREVLIPTNVELRTLESIVNLMTMEPMHRPPEIDSLPFHQTTLTTLLRDSFGGRAQTLFIVCCSPLEEYLQETLLNLQFAVKVQCIRNFVTMNAFMDNNTLPGHHRPIPDIIPQEVDFNPWSKLLSNADTLTPEERLQIEEWLYMKTKCESLSSTDMNLMGHIRSHLRPIQETDEPSDECFSATQPNSDNSDSESQNADLDEKIDGLMAELQLKTDELIKDRYNDYLISHPRAIFDSAENHSFAVALVPPNDAVNNNKEKSHGRERRRSIQPGQVTLSSVELEMLNRVACREQETNNNTDLMLLHPVKNSQLEIAQKKLRKAATDLEGTQRQIKELEQTITLKQKLMGDLIKNSDTRSVAKNRFNKKKHKLESEYEKTKKLLSKAVVGGKDKGDIEKLKAMTSHLEKRLQDLVSIKHIASESGPKVKKLQQSLQESKKQLESLQKSAKKEKKIKEGLEQALIELKSKGDQDELDGGKGKSLKVVNARLSHLDQVLREKSENLEKYKDEDKRESLRHEIRNLRRTRDHLLEQRFALDRKLKREKVLTYTEERKLLECDEAIEAIDAAIEFKNELICGRKSVDTSESLQREKGEQMLMARLNKLSEEEMRTLLYKYFQKVIDLRESSRKLESQLMVLERERDAWEWRERMLSNAVRQARLEGERNAVSLQRQHETKLTVMLRHLADETNSSTTTSMSADNFVVPSNHRELDMFKRGEVTKFKNKLDLYPMENQISKYKPLDNIKEKVHKTSSTNNKLFAKFQVLTRYTNEREKRKHHLANEVLFANNADHNNNPNGHHLAIIPTHNLKQLQPSSVAPSTKVTREKNKLIIEQQDNQQQPQQHYQHQSHHPHFYYRK